ncbi:MAG TPA: C25 family cysteine peptidase, partial [Kiritimatiellia bacterium]|nr:C25 family cysteine peptidase [Kiritimatiellia bacterium]
DVSLDRPVRPGPALRVSGDPAASVSWGDAVNVVDGRDQEVYGRDAFYPVSPATIEGFSQMRKWKMVRVRVSPAQYNPVQGTLRIVEHLDFQIRFARGRATQSAALGDAVMDAAALGLVENDDAARGWYATRTKTATSSGNTYLIMTTDEIYTASPTLYGLTTHKEDMGFTVHVVTETKLDGSAAATGWNEVTGQYPDGKADRMRKWLQNNYIGMQIEYVLLVGNPAPDWGDLPMKNCSYQAYVYPADGYYADLTGNWDIDGNGIYGNETNDVGSVGGVDRVPEVYVGRIPVYTADPSWSEMLRRIVWKSIKYEQEGYTGWRQSALLPESWSDSYTDGAYLGEYARTNYLSSKGYSAHTLFEQGSVNPIYDSSFPSDEELLDDSTARRWMNHDYGMVLWWGHGWSRGASVYAGGTLYESDQCPMLDDEHPASVFMVSCSCGDPVDDQNLGYSMLRNGGIASVAAANVSWYYYCSWSPADSKGMNASMGYDFFRKVVSNETTYGRALAEVKEEMDDWWNNFYTFNLYGDPSLRITSQGVDSDGDTMADGWEADHGLDAGDPDDAGLNPDGDSYSNLEEYRAGLDPQTIDSPASTHSSIAVPGTFNEWSTTAHPLRKIGGGAWQADIVLTNQTGVLFKFAANGSWTTNWGEYNQLATNAPFSGLADWESDNIVVAGTLDGSYRFTFNELTRGYRLEPTPAPDADLDGMPDAWETAHELNPHNGADAAEDPDYDGYTNLQEYGNGTDPHVWNPRAGNYNYVSVPGTFNGWNAAASNMCLVADHVWRYDATFSGESAIEFKFAANGSWAVNWGDTNQTQFTPPMAGGGESGAANLIISGSLSGRYRFTFNDQSLAWGVEAIATPDTDGDGMSDAWENARGLNYRSAADAGADADGDGLCNREECDFGSEPGDRDSDDDGAEDEAEFIAGTDPMDEESLFSAETA